MPDERQDSIRQGIAVPPESEIGANAAEERRERAAQGPEIGGAMGGTSDSDRPGDESQMNAARMAGPAADEGAERESGENPDREGENGPGEMYQDIPGDRVGG